MTSATHFHSKLFSTALYTLGKDCSATMLYITSETYSTTLPHTTKNLSRTTASSTTETVSATIPRTKLIFPDYHTNITVMYFLPHLYYHLLYYEIRLTLLYYYMLTDYLSLTHMKTLYHALTGNIFSRHHIPRPTLLHCYTPAKEKNDFGRPHTNPTIPFLRHHTQKASTPPLLQKKINS